MYFCIVIRESMRVTKRNSIALQITTLKPIRVSPAILSVGAFVFMVRRSVRKEGCGKPVRQTELSVPFLMVIMQ